MKILEEPGRDCVRVNSMLIRNDEIVDLRQADKGGKQEFAISETVESISDLLGDAVSAKGMGLIIDTDPDLPRSAIGDPILLKRIVVEIMENAANLPDSGDILISVSLQQELENEITVGFAFEYFGWANPGAAPANGRKTNIRRLFRFGIRLQKCPDSRPVRYERISNGQKALILSRSEALCKVLCRDLGIFGLDTRQSYSVDDAVERLRSGQDIKIVLIDSAISADMLDVFEQLRIETQFAVFIAIAPAIWNVTPEMKPYVTEILSKPVNRTAILQMLHKLLKVRGHGRGHGPGRILIDVADEKPEVDYGDKFKGLKVLFVEDNSVNQVLGRIILEQAGMVVDVAENGLKAVEQIHSRGDEIDIVLMDVQMPEMDGYEATIQIRKDVRCASIPIIAMTANILEGDRELCLAAGMNDYIGKPINREGLFSLIEKWTAHKR